MTPKKFVDLVASYDLPDTFNPYKDHCNQYDLPGAPKERRSALLSLIQTASQVGVDSLWVGRDLGYRGGRRTGLALTDEIHMESYAKRWGIQIRRVTQGPPVSERTADVIWRALNQISEKVLLWNVFPFHPYDHGDPFSNRAHSAAERRFGEEILAGLIKLTKPKTLIAVGNDAVASLSRYDSSVSVTKFRHPSFGGQTKFLQQVSEHYDLPMLEPQQRLFF
jgi:hypothetical protein